MNERHESRAITPDLLLERFTRAFETDTFPRIPTTSFAYAYFRHAASQSGIDNFDTYFSTAITSGGAALPDMEGNSLPFHVALLRNTDYALRLAGAAIIDNPTLLSAETSVNPVALGKVPRYHFETYGTHRVEDGSWGQDDYLRFWFAVILGLSAPVREESSSKCYDTELYVETLFETHRQMIGDIAKKMEDRSLPIEERQQAYLDFTYAFLACVEHMQTTVGLEVEPVKQIVELIDTERSLGCSAETELGSLMGVPALKLALTSNDWHERGLAQVTDDLELRGARFAMPTGKIALALAHKRSSTHPPSTVELSDRHKQQLESPFTYPAELFIQGTHVATDAPNREFYFALAAAFEFGSRRPGSYSEESLTRLLQD